MDENLTFGGILSFYRPQRSCGQGNIFAPVCHSVHRVVVSASVHAGIPPWEQTPQEQTPLEQTPPRPPRADAPPREQRPPRADTPQSRHPSGSRFRHTVNERPVRILLECILVNFDFRMLNFFLGNFLEVVTSSRLHSFSSFPLKASYLLPTSVERNLWFQ